MWHVDSQDDLEMTRLPEAMFDIRIIHLVRMCAPGFIPGQAGRKAGQRWSGSASAGALVACQRKI